MHVAPGQDLSSLNSLRSNAAQGDSQSLKKAAQQFEALLLQQMIKSMRDAVPRANGQASSAMSQYESLHDQQLAQELARKGTLGLAETIERQLSGTPALPVSPDRLHLHRASATAGASGVEGLKPGGAQTQFISEVRPYAERAAARLGIDPDILVAQAALETGWGQFVPRNAQGESSHNYFGIKADSRWEGEQVTHRTKEFLGGRARSQVASFRAYSSAQQSFEDYAEFVASQPRYQQALNASSAHSYLNELQRAGYATDPHYADKIMGILPRLRPDASMAAQQSLDAGVTAASQNLFPEVDSS